MLESRWQCPVERKGTQTGYEVRCIAISSSGKRSVITIMLVLLCGSGGRRRDADWRQSWKERCWLLPNVYSGGWLKEGARVGYLY